MAEHRSFYQDLTEIAEGRITELMREAEKWEARELTCLSSVSYLRASAFTIYLAWRDVTEGLHTEDDLKRLEALAYGTFGWRNAERLRYDSYWRLARERKTKVSAIRSRCNSDHKRLDCAPDGLHWK